MSDAIPPTLVLDSATPSISVGTSLVTRSPVSATPPTLVLDSGVLGESSGDVAGHLNVALSIGSYTPNTQVNYALTDDDFISAAGEDPIKVTRKRQADAYNQVQVEVLDRDNDYNIYVAEAKDQWNIDTYGLRPMSVITCHAICQQQVGRDMAQRVLQRALYIRNEYEFTLSWKYARLEPMDLVSLTDAGLGMNGFIVRITSVEEDDTGNLKMTAEDFLAGGLTAGTYSPAPTGGYVPNQSASSGNAIAPIIFQPPIELTTTPQIWIGTAGGENWGGAQVWVSTDGSTYNQLGTLSMPARIGTLTAALPAGSDPDVTNTLSVSLTSSLGSLTSVSQAQADALATLSYVDGELIAYEYANLTAPYTYNMSYLRRSQGGTPSTSHAIGTTFMRLDDAVAEFELDTTWVGSTIYIKLPSYNTTGGALQALSDVTATAYVVQYAGMVLPAGSVPSTIPAGQYFYIAPHTQVNLAHRMVIQGRLKCFGRLIIN